MEIIYKKVDELKPYEKNPRKNDDAVEYVANSIKEFGFKVPIIVDENNIIIAGHTRYKASKKLGIKEVPCIIADDLTEEQIKAFRLADNKVSEKAKWDTDLLGMELDSLFDVIDMNKFGFPVQIENIDGDEEGEEKITKELGEANNYVVLQFYTDLEWDEAQVLLGLERVQTGEENENIRRHGIGRVIDGKAILDKLMKLKELEDEDTLRSTELQQE